VPTLSRPPRTDAALAGVLAGYAAVEGLLIDASGWWVALAAAAMLPFAWRRVAPVAALGTVFALVALLGLAGVAPAGTVLPLPVLVLSGYTVGHEARSGRRAVLGATAIGLWMLAGVGFGTSSAENHVAEDLVALVVLVGASTGVGRLVRMRQLENARLRSLTAQLAAERDLVARAAVAEERARVARELHDVVAHGLSLIAVQAAAAEDLLDRDRERAAQALAAVQGAARDALDEMRRLLTILRDDDEPLGLKPQPGLGALAALVEEARGSGLPVALTESGPRHDVPAGVQLSVFRIVQEALTNVRKHAGATATDVRVAYAPDGILVEVANDVGDGGRAPGGTGVGGFGIAGMTERARLYGGTLDAGRSDGRFVVRARLPLREAR
jgi:signal transduction histidine kinase